MRLIGAVTEGSGAINEDGWGHVERGGEVTAAWVFDGVTGINGRNVLGQGTDAAWLVARADEHLCSLAAEDLPLPEILAELVAELIADWRAASSGLAISADFDPPAACLVLAKRYGDGWKALRLGDSCLLARGLDGSLITALPENGFDSWLAAEARKRRDAGAPDIKALLAEFRPQLLASRAKRNRAGGYGILEAAPVATGFAQYLELGEPAALLLCTDGFYRAVDHYRLCDDRGLIAACGEKDGVNFMLKALRRVEKDDELCQSFPRFKPADDATAVMLGSP